MKKAQVVLGAGIAGLVILMMMWLALRSTPLSTSIPWPNGGGVPNWDAAVADNWTAPHSVPRAISTLNGTIVDPLTFASGVSGTYTVPRGYVVALSAVAGTVTDAGGGVDAGDSGVVGATVTITPNGPSVTDSALVTQPPILIPSGSAWSISRPAIQGSANEMGTGTTIVFDGTVAYTVVMSLGGT